MQNTQRRPVHPTSHTLMTGMRRWWAQRAAAVFVACGTAVLLSACSAQTPASESPEQPTETAAGGAESEQSADSVGESGPSSETSDASAQAEAAGPTSTEGADSSASTPRCTVDDLETTVDQGDSSAGHLNFTITFANTSE